MRKHIPSFVYYKEKTDVFGLEWMPTTRVSRLDKEDWILDFAAHLYDLYPVGGGKELHWSSAVDAAFRDALTPHIESANAILEIGVFYKPNDQETSSTVTLLELKQPETVYIGLDLNLKSLEGDNIHTIVGDSFDQNENRQKFEELGVDSFDIICIDGDHSIDAAFNDWKYVDLLARGLVCMHDTNHHPGPHLLMEAIAEDLFDVWQGAPEIDRWEWGIGFARRKS